MNAEIKVEDRTLVVRDFATDDQEVVSYFSGVPSESMENKFESSLKLGVVALKTVGTAERIDYIEKEFGKLKQEFFDITEKTKEGIEDQIIDIFGEDGSFSTIINEHFGKDGKLVKQILDPSREGSPLYQLRTLIVERIDGLSTELGIEKEVEKVIEETPKKGFKFEDICEDLLSDVVKTHLGDKLERTTDIPGRVNGSKKGDFVIILGKRPDCRIVLETKDIGAISLPKIHKIMKEAIENRDAKYGIFVTKWAESLPKSVGCFNEYEGNQLVCAVTSKENEGNIQKEMLYVAVCWARIRSLLETAEAEGINVSLIQNKIKKVESKLQMFSSIKRECTNVQNSVKSIRKLSDDIKGGVCTQLDEIQEEIARVVKE